MYDWLYKCMYIYLYNRFQVIVVNDYPKVLYHVCVVWNLVKGFYMNNIPEGKDFFFLKPVLLTKIFWGETKIILLLY